MFPHTFLLSPPPSGNRKRNRNCHLCAHRHNFRVGRNCGHQRRRKRLFTHTHTPIHDGEYAHCIINSGTNQHHSIRGSIQRKLVKTMELQGSSCHTTFNFTGESSVIRMRTMSSSVSVTALVLSRCFLFSQCVANGTVMRNFSKLFSASHFD